MLKKTKTGNRLREQLLVQAEARESYWTDWDEK